MLQDDLGNDDVVNSSDLGLPSDAGSDAANASSSAGAADGAQTDQAAQTVTSEEYERLNEDFQRSVRAYNEMKGRAEAAQAEAARLRMGESAAFDERFKDRSTWVDTVSDPRSAQETITTLAERAVAKMIAERDSAFREMQFQNDLLKVQREFDDFVAKEAKLTPAETTAFLTKYGLDQSSFARQVGPARMIEMAKTLLKGEYQDRFAGEAKRVAAVDAEKKAKALLAAGKPAGSPPTVPGKLTPADEYMQGLADVGNKDNPDNWI